jgi:hypothetical protein
LTKQSKSKKKERDDYYENMSHLVSYWFVQWKPIYNTNPFDLQEMGRLWRKSAPELMAAELLIMFVLIV